MSTGGYQRRGRIKPGRVLVAVLVVLLLLGTIGAGIYTLVNRGGGTSSPASVETVQPTQGGAVGQVNTSPAATTAPAVVNTPMTTSATATSAPANNGATLSTPVPTSSESLGTVRCFMANYPSYYVASLIAQQFAAKYNFTLELVPMASGPNLDQNDFDEAQQANLLRIGEFDCGLTTVDTFNLQGEYGVNTLVVSMSRGSDFMVAREPNLTLQNILGRPIAAGLDSVSELLTVTFYYAGREDAADPTKRVMLGGVGGAEQALQRYLAGEANVMVGWIPVVNLREDGVTVFMYDEAGNEVDIGYKVIGSENLPSLIDGVMFSRQAIEQKPALVQAFHDAWFDGLKLMLEDPATAANLIVEWDKSHDGWTGMGGLISPDYPADVAMVDYMWGIAQATLQSNELLMQDHQRAATSGQRGILANQIAFTGELWAYGGKQVQSIDPIRLVDPQFVLATVASHPELVSDAVGLFTEKPFVLAVRPEVTPVDITGIRTEDVIANFPKETFEFVADSGQLTEESAARFASYARERMQPALKATATDVRLLCDVGSAWPPGDTAEGLYAFLNNERIPEINQLLGSLGVDTNRIVYNPVIPSDPAHIETSDRALQAQDRFIRCALVAVGGR